jgi:hypothetical protein
VHRFSGRAEEIQAVYTLPGAIHPVRTFKGLLGGLEGFFGTNVGFKAAAIT